MNVILYSTGCPKCEVLKKKLAEHDLKYIENDSVDEMLKMGITQVPVLSVNGELLDFPNAIRWINYQ